MDGIGVVSALGIMSIAFAILILGMLSKRMGVVTRSPRYHRGLYTAALLMAVSALARLVNGLRGLDPAILNSDPFSVMLYIGLPALAVSIAVIVAWRYWSWLLAERG